MRSFEMRREFIEIGDELYEVLRKIKEEHGPVIDTWKEHLMADKVFRKDGSLFFCRLVQDANVTEWKNYSKNTEVGSKD
jgi:hypothetical protein